MKKIILLLSICLFVATATLMGGDFVTIVDPIPSSYGTVTATPLVISGTSSQPNTEITLFFNGNQTSSAYTDDYGNWSTTSPYLGNGTYTLTANLTTPTLEQLAVDSVSFTVSAGDTISISSPTQADPIFLNPILLSGSSSLSNATVDISLDGHLIATTTTDAYGNWQYSYTLTAANGSHTVLAELLEYGYEYPVASATINITSYIPFIFPSGIFQARFVNGDIPTSGSGSGPGYTYTISGSSITINFVPAFSSTPSISVTGLRSVGSSTVTLSYVSDTAATLAFTTGTQIVHFSAAELR
jgi:hypothetical protein